MRHLFILAALVAVGYLAYKLYMSGEFGQKPVSPSAASASQQSASAQQQPTDTSQKAATASAEAAPAKPDQPKDPKPGDVIGGIISSGKRVGRGASKAFGAVDFGGK